jgi:GntR family transcriptional regulator, transcriptional repressor for pyruvate dehydrogenase complex
VVLLDSIGAVLFEIRRRSLTVAGRREQAVAEHQRILDALRGRDVDAARQAMLDHLGDSQEYYGTPAPEPR